jgi:hypothetical protein
LWSIEPTSKIEKKTVMQALFVALLIAEAGMVLSFIPMNQSIYALILTSLYYGLSGLVQVYLQGSFFKERIREYIFVFIFTFIIFVLGLRW